jgi:DNA mismatch endonuclease (patch repair protein)
LPRYKVAIFVHGCFWHLHAGCRDGRIPKSNVEFWTRKLTGNKTRDEKNMAALAATGWRPIIVWECEIERYMDKVEKLLVAHILNKAT